MTHQPCVLGIFVTELLLANLLQELWSTDLILNMIINYGSDIFLLVFLKMANYPIPPGINITKLLLFL